MNRGEPRTLAALAGSFLLHAAVLLLLGGAARHVSAAGPGRPETRELADRWGGNTFEVDDLLGEKAGQAPGNAAPAEPEPMVEPDPEPPAPQPVAKPEPKAAPQVEVEPEPKAEPDPAPPKAEAEANPNLEAPEPVPVQPEPDPRQAGTPVPRPAGSSAPSAGSATPPGAPGPGGTPSYGAAGLPAGVRSLAKAFTRAIPAATNLDPAWVELPLGAAGEARVVLEVGEDGHLSRVPDPLDAPAPPTHLRRLLDRVLLMLKSGRFALSRADTNAGRETLRLRAVIEKRAPSDDDFADPGDTVELGFEPPTLEREGRAFFKKASGRYIEIHVSIESSG